MRRPWPEDIDLRFSFIHAADLHLDTPFAGLGALREDLARRLVDASLQAFDRIVARATEERAAFVVLAGDVYDGDSRGLRAQLRLRDGLARLHRAGIKAFIAHGNHDPEGGRYSAIARWPEGVNVFPPGQPSAVDVEIGGRRVARVHGISYGTRQERENLALRFPVVDGAFLHVGVLHANVGDAEGHAPYSPCSLEDLRSRGHAYWALGHVHRHAVLGERPHVVYPGNTQGRSFAPGELGEKGALIVDVEDGQVVGLRRFATDTARFLSEKLDIAALGDLGDLHDALKERADAARSAHGNVELLLLRGTLEGRGPLGAALRDESTRQAALEAAQDAAGDGVHWLGLDAACAPALDLDALRRGDDLRAEVLATADAWGDAVPEAVRLALGACGEAPDAQTLRAMIADASLDLIGLLSGDESTCT